MALTEDDPILYVVNHAKEPHFSIIGNIDQPV